MHFRGTKSILHAYVFHVFTLFATFSQICFVDSEIPKIFKSAKSILHVLSRSSRFLAFWVFLFATFSRFQATSIFLAQRCNETEVPKRPTHQTTKRPKTSSLSQNFQYLPVISSQKWSCKCCKWPKYSESSLSHTCPPLRSECNVCNVCNVKLESDNDRTREYKRSNLEVNSSYVLSVFFAWQVANGTRTDEALLRNSNSLSQWSCLGCNECYSAILFALCHSLSICHPFSISSNIIVRR